MSSGPQRAAEQDEEDRVKISAARIRARLSELSDEELDSLYGQTIGVFWQLRNEGLSFIMHNRLDRLRCKWQRIGD